MMEKQSPPRRRYAPLNRTVHRRLHVYSLDLSPGKKDFLQHRKTARRSLTDHLRRKGFVVSFDFDQMEVTVEADSDEDTSEVLRLIDEEILEMQIPMSPADNLPVQFDIDDLGVLVRKDDEGESIRIVGLMSDTVMESLRHTMNIKKDQDYKIDLLTTLSEIVGERQRTPKQTDYGSGVSRLEGYTELKENIRPASRSDLVAEVMEKFYTTTEEKTKHKNVTSASGLSPSLPSNRASVTVRFGDIQDTLADAIVNSSNKRLNLNMGKGMSTIILREAGGSIQTELHRDYPNGLGIGDVAKSGPGRLSNCKAIYHGVLPMFPVIRKGRDECFKALVTVTINVLLMASSDGLISVEFPALGTGVLGYPVQEVVQLMFLAVSQFFEKIKSPIQDVCFVIHPKADPSLKKFFLMENLSSCLHTVKVGGSVLAHKVLQMDPTKICETRFEIGKANLQVCNGNIKDFLKVTMAVLILWDKNHIEGKEDNPVVCCFSKSLQSYIISKYANELKQNGKKFVIDDTSFQSPKLVHLYRKDDTDDVAVRAIDRGIKQLAEFSAIAIPVPSDGTRTWQPHVASEIIIRAMKELKSHHVVRVIVEDRHLLEPFLTAFMDRCGRW